jgi:calcineurin-like phosphoesterase family protein
MDETMVRKWNEKIGPRDSVYHIGDFALNNPAQFKEILKLLNGSIYLVKGNHEDTALKCKGRFEWIKDYYELKVPDDSLPKGRQKIVLFHYAIRQWQDKHSDSFHLHGHSHGMLEDDKKSLSIDVGVDCHNFYPLEYSEVKEIMLMKDWKPPVYRSEF